MDFLVKLRDRLDQIGAPEKKLNTEERDIFDHRDNEPGYAKLFDPKSAEVNQWGQKIDLLDLTQGAFPEGKSMMINENPTVGDNPNRNKQHGFHFTADNCIGCHACEAACSEKNENPAHIAFRSVGYVEGGTYPDYKRMNISMACNHCDNPVCLKGCPTKAYTKHVEYGAVLQDPETCFGCGYCTWVCPYNAPQLDPIQGQVSKCNMCVDRLEVGLKPACVAACLGNALNFGVVDNTPQNREQVNVSIPGFPDPEITHPNIRFQQKRTMPDEMTRTDTMPIKYHKQGDGSYRSVVDEKIGKEASWNIARLSSRENPLVIFTLSTQAVFGAFVMLFLGSTLDIAGMSSLQGSALFYGALVVFILLELVGLVMSTMHLGKPHRFYRGFNNLKMSPLSREALGIALFFAGMTGFAFLSAVNEWLEMSWVAMLANVAGAFAVVSGLIGLFYMNRIYRIKARPFWDHWQVLTSFFGSALSAGGILLGLLVAFVSLFTELALSPEAISLMCLAVALGLIAEGIGLKAHAHYLNTESGEGAAAHYIQQTTFGKTYALRNLLILCGAMIALVGVVIPPEGLAGSLLFSVIGLAVLAGLLMGRALFYVLVIPTTMPGAFFWKNKGFEEHARDIGLADMPQVGVVPHLH